MSMQFFAVAASLLILLNGCASVPLPGGTGEVSGPLEGIELYTKRPQQGELYPTAARERLFASDREVHVLSYWTLPGPGDYASKIVLRTPAGAVHREREYRFRAEAPAWLTGQRIELPQGEAAQPLAGRWEVGVFLDGKPVGRRAFTFDPSGIRLRTDARLVIVQGKVDPEAVGGEWRWTRPYAVSEHAKAASRMLALVLRDELARRFPHVDGPRVAQEASDATVLLTTTLLASPGIDADSRLELEILHLPTKTLRKFVLATAAGRERFGRGSRFSWNVAAADLAAKAASSPEVLEFLVRATQAVSE